MLKPERTLLLGLILLSSILLSVGCGSSTRPGVPSGGSDTALKSESAGTRGAPDSATPSFQYNKVIVFETEWGEIVVRLDLKQAPLTGSEFLKHVRNAHLDGSSFYRTVTLDNQPGHPTPIEVIQGGRLPWVEGADPDYPGFAHETTAETGLLHQDGTLSMARDEPGSATTEFFICIGPQPALDFGGARNPDGQGFAAFGQVIKGMDVVRKIHQANQSEQRLEPPIRIRRVMISPG